MRKRVCSSGPPAPAADDWLNLEQLVQVEVTSEDPAAPIEAALLPGADGGWQATAPGTQTIRLIFDQPHTLRRIWLQFVETTHERTQEFVLRWSPDGGHTFHEIVRQQWNFSPAGAPEEVEDYQVTLARVTVLELTIVPDTRGGPARASLAQLRLA
jgi:hypothetical protein